MLLKGACLCLCPGGHRAFPSSDLCLLSSGICFGQKFHRAWLARSFEILGSDLELVQKCPAAYLCISGGSRLILALDSITSFATRPLLKDKIKINRKKGDRDQD